MDNSLIVEAVGEQACPTCNTNTIVEFSLLSPILVQCTGCGMVWQLAYVVGYWQGYQKSQQENGNGHHENYRVQQG